MKGQKLGTVTSFKYLRTVVSDDDSKREILSRIAQATAALARLKPIRRDNKISLRSKVKLMRSLVTMTVERSKQPFENVINSYPGSRN